MSKLEINNVTVSEAYTNCYICKNKETKEGFIVDPGDNELKISQYVTKMDMKPKAIILTHGHFDHIGAVEALKKRYNIKVYAAKEEQRLLQDVRKNLSEYMGNPVSVRADVFLEDGEEINIADFNMKFILTPGHTEGSGCYYLKDEQILFSGDTMFNASYGRTDFPGGSEKAIMKSIKEKLLVLPGNTTVLPGHMSETTIESEKVYY